jgi:hypothetical protein
MVAPPCESSHGRGFLGCWYRIRAQRLRTRTEAEADEAPGPTTVGPKRQTPDLATSAGLRLGRFGEINELDDSQGGRIPEASGMTGLNPCDAISVLHEHVAQYEGKGTCHVSQYPPRHA